MRLSADAMSSGIAEVALPSRAVANASMPSISSLKSSRFDLAVCLIAFAGVARCVSFSRFAGLTSFDFVDITFIVI
jgi:hypothetical protein